MPEIHTAIILFKYTTWGWSKSKTRFKYFSRAENEMSTGVKENI